MHTVTTSASKTDEKFLPAFVYSPSWGHDFYFLEGSVGINFWTRDHGDKEPVDSVDDLGVTSAEFFRVLQMAQSHGSAEAGHMRVTRLGGDGLSVTYRFGYYNHFYKREHNFTQSASEVANMLNMARIFASS